MSEVKERPNFTISYRKPPEVDYEEFKKDFLDCFVKIDEIREKYDLTKSEFMDYRQRVLDETGLKRKPTYSYRPIHFFDDAEYIQKKNNGFIVVKSYRSGKDTKTKYFGRYADYNTAKMIRDKLVESDWDEGLGAYLKQKYALSRVELRPAYAKAEELYPEFKELYLHSPLQVKEIKAKLELTNRVYKYLLDMVRDELDDIDFRRVPRR